MMVMTICFVRNRTEVGRSLVVYSLVMLLDKSKLSCMVRPLSEFARGTQRRPFLLVQMLALQDIYWPQFPGDKARARQYGVLCD